MSKVDFVKMILDNEDLKREKNIFLNHGDFWLIRYEGGDFLIVRSILGYHYIQYSLDTPGKLRTVEEAEAWVEGVIISEDEINKFSDQELNTGFRDTLTDLQATAEFHDRLEYLRKKIIDHKRGKKILSEEEIRKYTADELWISEHLKKVTNVKGKPRFEANDVKRNRDRITAARRRSLKELNSTCPPLGQHLRDHFVNRNEGGYFPEDPISWFTNSSLDRIVKS